MKLEMEGEFWKYVLQRFGINSEQELRERMPDPETQKDFASSCIYDCKCKDHPNMKCFLQQCMDLGFPVEVGNPTGWQLLHEAAAVNSLEHCLFLLRQNANVNACTDDYYMETPMGLSYRHPVGSKVATLLFEHGARYIVPDQVVPQRLRLVDRHQAYFSARIEACRRAAGAATHALRANGMLKDLATLVGKAIWATQRRPEWADLIQ